MKTMRGFSRLIGGLVGLALFAMVGTAQATPILITFDVFAQGGSSGSGSGTALVDGSLLAPSTTTISDFTNLTGFSLTMSGLPSIPSSTSFSLGDLFSYILETDATGTIIDFNWRTFAQNADGYGLNAIAPTVVDLCQSATGNACSGGTPIGRYDITNYQTFVPEPSTLFLFLIALGGLGFMTRRRRVV